MSGYLQKCCSRGILLITVEKSYHYEGEQHESVIMAMYHRAPFYSFFIVKLTDDKDNGYTPELRNDIEPERAFIHFAVES